MNQASSPTHPLPIIVIDDDLNFQEVIAFLLESHGFTVKAFEDWESASGSPGLSEAKAILLDRRLGNVDGLDLIPLIKEKAPNIPIVLTTADHSAELIVNSIKAGAFDFVGKPLDEARLVATLTKAASYGDLLNKVETLRPLDNQEEFEGMVGRSPQIQAVFQTIRNVAPTDVNVMISGDSGTGKELVAKAVHEQSARREKPFVALNMAGMPSELVESILFGHEKGAFTGAEKKRIGACEEAQGGTLFLDEITEMPIDLQPKLLRFLQERTIRRVGGDKDINLNVRVLAATNRDPMQAVHEDKFRLDLYYRLNVVPIQLPALKDRMGDVKLLAERFLKDLSKKHKRKFKGIDQDVIERMNAHHWPGNVRELFHLIERIVVLNDGGSLTTVMLPDFTTEVSGGETSADSTDVATPANATNHDEMDRVLPGLSGDSESQPVHEAGLFTGDQIIPMAELEKMAIEHALKCCNGSASKAAHELGMSNATIYRRIKDFGIQA